MKCYKCKTECMENSQFCPSCGAALQITQEVIQKAVGKEALAVEQLFYMSREQIYYAVRTIIWDEEAAFLVVEDSYVKAVKTLRQLKNPAAFVNWMKKIALDNAVQWIKNTYPDVWIRKAAADAEPQIPDNTIQTVPPLFLSWEQTKKQLDMVLKALPVLQRTVSGMYYGQQMSTNEISELTGISEDAVKECLQQAQENIRKYVPKAMESGDGQERTPEEYLMCLYACLLEYCGELASEVLLQGIQKKTVGKRGRKAAKAVGVAAMAVAGESVGEVAKEGIKATITKLIAGLTATAVIGGGTGAAVLKLQENKTDDAAAPVIQQQVQTQTEAAAIEEMAETEEAQDSLQQAGTTENSGIAETVSHLLTDFSEIEAEGHSRILSELEEIYRNNMQQYSLIDLNDGENRYSFPMEMISAVSDLRIGKEGYFAKEMGHEGNIWFVPCYATLEDVVFYGTDGSTDFITYEDAVGFLRVSNLVLEEDGEILYDDFVDFTGFYTSADLLYHETVEMYAGGYRIDTVSWE